MLTLLTGTPWTRTLLESLRFVLGVEPLSLALEPFRASSCTCVYHVVFALGLFGCRDLSGEVCASVPPRELE